MQNNPLPGNQAYGQSIWQDFISHRVTHTGALRRRIEAEGLRGVTSNPAILNEAIGGSPDYDDDIRELARHGKSTAQIYEPVTVRDVDDAANLFRPLYDASDGRHGFVSLEVNPHLSKEIEPTHTEARYLWHSVNRPNVMIKVPATREGLTSIEQRPSGRSQRQRDPAVSLGRDSVWTKLHVHGFHDARW